MSTGQPETAPRLLADIGGTNARFALQIGGRLHAVQILRCADYSTPQQAIRHYLAASGAAAVRHAGIGIANPVLGDQIRMTNHPWSFSIEQLRRELGLETLLVLNDFAALAHALPHLPANELLQIGGDHEPAPAHAVRGLVGPGTGLGVAAVVPASRLATVIAGEGGHVSFSPADEREIELWRFARARHGHVSAERLLSGPGLELIHAWLASADLASEPRLGAAQISAGAASGDPVCGEALAMFFRLLGGVAGDLALTLGARGGIYIGGGIVPRLVDLFVRSEFRSRFEAKGRFRAYLEPIPTFVIQSALPGLSGIAAALESHLGGDDDA